MLKINPAFCFKPEDLIQFLRSNPKETTIAEEIAAAVTHRLIMEEELGWSNYAIYFEPADAKQSELLQKIGTSVAYTELESFIKQFAEQGTPVDYAFINMDTKPAGVYPVQHKRYFSKHDNEVQEIEAFAEEISKWRNQYAPNEATMLIHYRGDIRNVDFETVMEDLNKNGFPFREVLVLTITENEVIFIQLLPNDGDGKMGWNTYSRERMLGRTHK